METSSPAAPRTKKIALLDPAIIFLMVASVIGALYCIVIPYGAGFDEEAHMVRIYDISGNNLLPNRNPPAYKYTLTYREFHDLSYQRRDFQTPAFDMFTPESLSQKFSRKEEDILYGYTTNSIYSPLIFLPQAVIARVFWRTFDFPILPVAILARLAGLLVYLAGGYLAIRFIPFGKWPLMALALAPMALFQASTLNTDGFLSAVSFLFIGLTLCVYAKASPTIKSGWVWALVGVSLLLGAGKLGAVVLLPLLLLPMSRLKSKKWIGVLAVGAVLALLLNVGWTALALPNSRFSSGTSHDPSETLTLILSQSVGFLWGFVQSMITSFSLYTRNWMASYGYWVGDVPAQVYWFYALVLILTTLISEPIAEMFSRRARFFTLGMFLLSSAIVIGMYYTLHYTPGILNEMRQGRYSIPYVPLLLIALCGLFPLRESWQKLLKFVALGCLFLALGYYSFGLYATYYTDCGYPAYAGGECELPVYKSLEIASAPEIKLTGKMSVSQKFTALCTGLKEVDVIIRSTPPNGTGTLIFSLLDAGQKELARKQIPASQIQAEQYISLPVLSVPAAKGASYEIRLESLGVAASNAFGVLFQPQHTYSGQLVVADQVTSGNLVFHYICSRP